MAREKIIQIAFSPDGTLYALTDEGNIHSMVAATNEADPEWIDLKKPVAVDYPAKVQEMEVEAEAIKVNIVGKEAAPLE